MDTIVQWATILSPIIAVLIAVWVVISSKKDTDKQIESIKALSKLQIEILATEIEMETIKNKIIAQQANQESVELGRIMENNYTDFREMALRDYEARKPERNRKYVNAYLQELKRLNEKLVQIKNKSN
jgi:hypothetical protein